MSTVLIVDDEKNVRSSLASTFRLEGYRAETAEDGRRALEAVERGGVDLIVLDLHMPGPGGIEVLRALRRRGHDIPVMILTAHGTIDSAVEATRLGAFDFVEKPVHADRILLTARNALRQARLEEENRELRVEVEGRYEMIGSAPSMLRLYEQIERVAPTEARVLVTGENGTGKELIARALHHHSRRSGGPFIILNCASVPRDLFESDLFGHEKGAFTGATARRRGKLVRAHTGTIFLDEVGEIPLDLQAKLLRALETGEVEPVGSDREIRVDARVLAATNRDLERAVAEGLFRDDLYYRLKVVTLVAPALRERREDIPALAGHFLSAACAENHLRVPSLSSEAMRLLVAHDWPGNVRELRNLVERLVILCPGQQIEEAQVAEALPEATASAPRGRSGPRTLREAMDELERGVIREALERHGWTVAAAARELNLERSHLYKKMRALGIERPD